MQWTQLCVHGTLSDRDTICAILCMLDENIVLEDYSDIDMKTVYADLIDEKILHADKNNITASIYVSEDKPLGEYISFLKDRFRIAHIDAQIACNGVKEEEWATANITPPPRSAIAWSSCPVGKLIHPKIQKSPYKWTPAWHLAPAHTKPHVCVAHC